MIYLGADHDGFHLKEEIKEWLTYWDMRWKDLGNRFFDPDDDYPEFAIAVAEKVTAEEIDNPGSEWKSAPKGILLTQSAAGMVIAANRINNTRAVAVSNDFMVKTARTDFNANVIVLSGEFLSDEEIKVLLKTFFATDFSGARRHVRRIKQIDELTKRR